MPKSFGCVIVRSLVCAAVAACGAAASGDVVFGSAADRTILDLSPTDILSDGVSAEVGVNGGIMRTYVVPFQLPARPAGTVVTAADIQFRVLRNMQTSTMNVDLYALTPRASSTVLASDQYAGPLDSGAGSTLIQNDFITVAGTDINNYVWIHTDAAGDATLADYLNDAYASHGAGSWVFFRLSCDQASVPNINFYFVSSSDWLQFTTAYSPRLELTFGVPAPGAASLMAMTGLVTARRRRRG